MANDKIQPLKDKWEKILPDVTDSDIKELIKLFIVDLDYLRSLSTTESMESDAVEFAEWIGNNEFKRNQEGEDIWYESNGEGIGTTKELYKLFKQSNQNR